MARKSRNKKEEGTDESWLLPYADMLTLLLALFIVLFAMSEIDLQKFERLAGVFNDEFSSGSGILEDGETLVPERDPDSILTDPTKKEEEKEEDETEKVETLQQQEYEQLQEMKADIDDYIAESKLKDTIGTEITPEGLFITIRTDITFDSGSATVKERGIEIAEEIAPLLSTEPPHEIVVHGHADDRPLHNETYASNWELSSMRAIQFMYLLLEESTLDPQWFSTRGYGEYRPAVPNTSEENRRKNRRVEVLILPNYDIEGEIPEEIKKEQTKNKE